VYVTANSVTQEDMLGSEPDPKLATITQKVELGHVDAFVSHSWHDDPVSKWERLQEWRVTFKAEHNGREPRLWIDKYCLNQNSIDDSLACLPVYLAGCSKLLILCGTTYLQRLWCLVEIFIFLEMGGRRSHLDVRILKSGNMLEAVQQFDSRNATCFTEHDTERLRKVVEVTGHDQIMALLYDVFGSMSMTKS